MVKLFALLLLASCGESKCHKYAEIWCAQALRCGLTVSPRNSCIEATMQSIDDFEVTEEQCETTDKTIRPMNCDQLIAFVRQTQR